MKMSSRVVLLILVFMTLTVVSASETKMVDVPVNLSFTCTLNERIPSSGTVFNISIYNAKTGQTIVQNVGATALTNGEFYYPITFTTKGFYVVNMFCFDGVYNSSSSDLIEVKEYGEPLNTPIFFSYFGGIVLLLLLIIMTIYITVQLPSGDSYNDDNEIIQISLLKNFRFLGWSIVYILFVTIVFIFANFSLAYLNNEMLGNLFFAVYQILFVGLLIGVPLTFIYLLYKLYEDREMQRLLERGFHPLDNKAI